MSTDLQKIEAKLSAQERLIQTLQARIEALRHDMTASFRQLVDYQTLVESKMDNHFDTVEGSLAAVATTMATREDLVAMESRILAAFQQLVTVMDTHLPSGPRE